MPPEGWANAKALAEAVNTAGFTAFIAYEWTRSGNHQIVMYQSPEQELFDSTIGPYSVLVESLEPAIDDFMIIPHPMSFDPGGRKMYQPGELDERYTRVAEFHSDHASGPQEFELGALEDCGTNSCAQTNGLERINTLQYAWGNHEGNKPHLHVGVVGSSDNHFQQPGLNHHTTDIIFPGSLAAVLATQNDRNGIWDGLFTRRTYGTTGPRIYLDFEVNGKQVGNGFVTTGTRTFTIRAAGAEPLERVEVVRFVPDSSGGGTYTELLSVDSGFANGGYTYENTAFVDSENLATLTSGEAFYYLRVFEKPQQEQGCTSPEDSNCIPQGYALSSPIWVSVNDCNTNGIADLLDISNGLSTDCDHNFIPDTCELAVGSSEDIDTNGVPDHCEDCNTNGVPDSLDFAAGTSGDCDGDLILDECEQEPDCNANDIPDDCDIAGVTSTDCNANGVPDECDIAADPKIDCNLDGTIDDCEAGRTAGDCQPNGVHDDCDIDAGTSLDCDSNGVPDECDPDCDTDGHPDACEIAAGSATDCGIMFIGIPDDCEIAAGTSADVNESGLPDRCEDCNANDITDDSDIAAGTSVDCDSNGVPDECQPDCDSNGVADPCDCFRNDFDRDGDSDLQDYAFYQLCETVGMPIGFNCSAFSDCNTNGTLDFPSLQEATTSGFTTSDGFVIQAGPGIPCFAPDFEPISGFAAKMIVPSTPSRWMYLDGEVLLEVRRIDGKAVTGALRPNTLYALHYEANFGDINFLMASVIADSLESSIAQAAAVNAGDWASDDTFLFAPMADDFRAAPRVDGFGPGSRQTHVIVNHMLNDPTRTAGADGRLFNFKTGMSGTVTIQVYLESMDNDDRVSVMADGEISITVAD